METNCHAAVLPYSNNQLHYSQRTAYLCLCNPDATAISTATAFALASASACACRLRLCRCLHLHLTPSLSLSLSLSYRRTCRCTCRCRCRCSCKFSRSCCSTAALPEATDADTTTSTAANADSATGGAVVTATAAAAGAAVGLCPVPSAWYACLHVHKLLACLHAHSWAKAGNDGEAATLSPIHLSATCCHLDPGFIMELISVRQRTHMCTRNDRVSFEDNQCKNSHLYVWATLHCTIKLWPHSGIMTDTRLGV